MLTMGLGVRGDRNVLNKGNFGVDLAALQVSVASDISVLASCTLAMAMARQVSGG